MYMFFSLLIIRVLRFFFLLSRRFVANGGFLLRLVRASDLNNYGLRPSGRLHQLSSRLVDVELEHGGERVNIPVEIT